MFSRRLARRIVAQPMRERVDPAERTLGAADLAERTALAEKISNTATGFGLDHSPKVHALYQPTEPEVARRTSASQLDSRTTALGPWRENRGGACPSGSVSSIPPQSSRRSIWSSTLDKAGAVSRASNPPPVAKPRSACTRCSPRVLMAASYEFVYRLSSGTRNVDAAQRGKRWSLR